MNTANTMISEVEKNQKLVRVNDVLFYVDSCNSQKWVVTELVENGFIASDSENNEELFLFSDLQIGWVFSSITKNQNSLNYRFKYAA
jgi:hypothetical protein